MDVLSKLSAYLSNPNIQLNNKLLNICLTVKSAISTCDRVGIWLFSTDHSEMVLLMCVDELDKKSMGEQLSASTYEGYFSHIIQNDILVASDAKNNEISKCFNVGYFDVHDIHSLLDVTFMKDSSPLGIICCERTGDKTDWQLSDIAMLRGISTEASLLISNNVSDIYCSKSKDN